MADTKCTQALVTAKSRSDGQRQDFEVQIPSSLLNASYGGEAIARSLIEQELSDMGLQSAYTVKSWTVH